jgi:hypothetical protein
VNWCNKSSKGTTSKGVNLPEMQTSIREGEQEEYADLRWPSPLKSLPKDVFRNHSGLLICDRVTIQTLVLNVDRVSYETEFLKEYVVIIRFAKVGGQHETRRAWLKDLVDAIKLGIIQHHREVGFGFFYIKLDKPEIVKRTLVLSPCRCSFGSITVHRWVPAFNSLNREYEAWSPCRRRMCIKGPKAVGPQPILYHGTHCVPHISGMLRSKMIPMMSWAPDVPGSHNDNLIWQREVLIRAPILCKLNTPTLIWLSVDPRLRVVI